MKKRVFCTIVTALVRGMCVCYDRDRVTDERGNSFAATVVNTGRFRVVETPALGNIEDFAGWVAADYGAAPTGEAGRFIEILTPTIGACVPVYAKATCVINSTILGPVPGQAYMVQGAVFSPWAVKAIQTVDRGTTAGEVQGVVIRSDCREARDSAYLYDNHWNARGGAAEWTETLTNSSTPACDPTLVGGVLKLTNAAADNDSVSMQSTLAVCMQTNKALHFKTRVKWTDANNDASTVAQVDTFIGLEVTDTDVEAGRGIGLMFGKDDGDANLDLDTCGSGGETKTDTTFDIVANTWYTLELVFDGTKITAYVDGVLKLTVTSTTAFPLSTDVLRLTVEHQNGEAVAKILSIDQTYLRAAV